MDTDSSVLLIKGLPITCNPTKIKLRFEADCKVSIKDIDIQLEYSTITFPSSREHRNFLKKFPPSIRFGNEIHPLSIVDNAQSCGKCSTVPKPNGESNSSEQGIFQSMQTWSSIKEIPACKSGILVQSRSHSLRIKDIWNYFESDQESRGGTIKDAIPMIDGLFITFKDATVADLVWNSRPHRINGEAVTVHLKLVPQRYNNKLVVKHRGINTSEQDFLQLMATCSEKNIQLKIHHKASGAYLCAFTNIADENILVNIVKDLKEGNPLLDISFLMMTDCIELKPVPPELSDQEVKVLFENRTHSVGGNVTRVDRCESSMLVYFGSYEDARRIIETSTDRTIQIFGSSMKIRSYFHDFFAAHKCVAKNPIDDFITSLFTQEDKKNDKGDISKLNPFLYAKIDPNLITFLMEHPEHSNLLKQQLKSIGQGKVTDRGIKVNLKLNSPENRKHASNIIATFLKDYASMKTKLCHETKRNMVHDQMTFGSNLFQGLMIRWTENLDEVTVTGLKTEVESFLQSQQPFSTKNALTVEPQEMRWFVETGVLDQLRKTFPSIASCSENKISFSGRKSDVVESQNALKALMKNLTRKEFYAEKEIIDFLLKAEEKPAIYSDVTKLMMKQNIQTILVIKNQTPYLMGSPNCSDLAATILKSTLVLDESIELAESDSDSEMWKILANLENHGKVRIAVEKNLVVSIAGFEENVKEAKKKCAAFGVLFRKEIKIERGALEYIKEYFNLKEICDEHSVLYEISKNGLLLRGKIDDIEKVTATVEKLRDGILKEMFSINKHGLSKFLKCMEGQSILSKAQMKHRSVILHRLRPSQREQKQGDTKPAGSLPLVSGISSILIGKLNVSIREGDLTEDENDAIVNSVSRNFDLSKGSLSKAILQKGGNCIHAELSKRKGNRVRVTSSGKLPCKKILHVVFPSSSKDVIACFVELLKVADNRRSKSISIPAIRTGANLKSDSLMRLMLRSFRQFEKETQIKHLHTIDIVVCDKLLLEDFKKELQLTTGGAAVGPLMSTRTSLTPSRKQQCSRKIGDITVAVRNGDITEERNHAIINSTGPSFNLSKGLVSQAIIKKGGQFIQEYVKTAPGQFLRVTDAGRLKCIKIIHLVTPKISSRIGGRFLEALELAEAERFPSLSVPAIGTGVLEIAVGKVAEVMIASIQEFVKKKPNVKYLRKIDFVIYDPAQMKEFQDAIVSETTDNSPEYDGDCVEFTIFFLRSDKKEFRKLVDYLQEHLKEALSSVVINDSIDGFAEKEDKLLKDMGKKFDVALTRSDGQINIEGLSENRVQAKKELENLLKEFVLLSV